VPVAFIPGATSPPRSSGPAPGPANSSLRKVATARDPDTQVVEAVPVFEMITRGGLSLEQVRTRRPDGSKIASETAPSRGVA